MKKTTLLILLLCLCGCKSPQPLQQPTKPTRPPMPKILFAPLAIKPPLNPVYKKLPEFKFDMHKPAVWVLQYSYDLTNWHNLVHTTSYIPIGMVNYTAPNHGSCFFRWIGRPYPPESFH